MYKYSITKDQKTMQLLKKIQIKTTLPPYLMLLGISDAILFLLWIGFIVLIKRDGLYFLGGIIIYQIIISIAGYKKCVNDVLRLIRDCDVEIDFNEKELITKSENSIKKISWQAVKEVKIYDEYMVIRFNLMDLPGLVYLFDSFDRDKDEIINHIEKYAEIRR